MEDFVTKKVPQRLQFIWNAVIGFRWIMNCILVATAISFFFLVINILMFVSYAILNRVWAQGNLFWVLNWLFLVSQSLSAIPLLYEVTLILRWIRPLRLMSLTAGIVYNIAYLSFVSDLFWLHFGTNKEEIDEL